MLESTVLIFITLAGFVGIGMFVSKIIDPSDVDGLINSGRVAEAKAALIARLGPGGFWEVELAKAAAYLQGPRPKTDAIFSPIADETLQRNLDWLYVKREREAALLAKLSS